ncbi:MAG TPA: rod shape-determining protein MreC, partial [Tepidisphaeraceae bacterium]|nr:rod shape-determining protein MreC [Tepidisphaeraceae bacterium]
MRLRFNQIFPIAFLFCIISAFVLPGWSNQSWNNAAALFAPVSIPAGRAAAWVAGMFRQKSVVDQRPDIDIRRENQQLKVEVAQLQSQLQTVAKMAAERRQLGPLLDYCVGVQVIGVDSSDRQALNVQPSESDDLRVGQPVVCPLGLVGQVQSASRIGAKVRLITDKS